MARSIAEGQDVGYGPSNGGGNDGTCNAPINECNGYTGGIVNNGPGNLLYPSAFGPNNSGNVDDPSIIGSHVDVIAINEAKDTVNQGKLDATWRHDSTKLNFGVQFVGDTRTSESWTTFINGNNQWELFAGYGPASHNSGGVALPASLFNGAFSTANFIPGYGGNANLPSSIPWYSPYPVTAYEESLGVGAANPNYGPTNGYTYDGTVTPGFDPASPIRIRRTSYAPFVTGQHDFDLGGMTLTTNAGLRYDRTDVTAGGVLVQPTSLTVEASDHTAFIYTPYSRGIHKQLKFLSLPAAWPRPQSDGAAGSESEAGSFPHGDEAAAEPDLPDPDALRIAGGRALGERQQPKAVAVPVGQRRSGSGVVLRQQRLSVHRCLLQACLAVSGQ